MTSFISIVLYFELDLGGSSRIYGTDEDELSCPKARVILPCILLSAKPILQIHYKSRNTFSYVQDKQEDQLNWVKSCVIKYSSFTRTILQAQLT